MNFKDLRIWQDGFKLSIQVLKLTKKFPPEEKFNLTSQINRCAVSIPSNIAEGHARDSQKDFSRFCSIAKGSANELETQILIAQELEYLSKQDTDKIVEQAHSVIRQLIAFQKTLQ